MAYIDIDIEDHLDEIEAYDLIIELKGRFKRSKRKGHDSTQDFLEEVLSGCTLEDLLNQLINSKKLSLIQGIKLKEFINELLKN
jgi:hypothetical protein